MHRPQQIYWLLSGVFGVDHHRRQALRNINATVTLWQNFEVYDQITMRDSKNAIKASPLEWCGSTVLRFSHHPSWYTLLIDFVTACQRAIVARRRHQCTPWSVVLNVSLLLLWHFLLTLLVAYKTSVQARVVCAPWHSSRIWFVP